MSAYIRYTNRPAAMIPAMAYSIELLLHVLGRFCKSPEKREKYDDHSYIENIQHGFTPSAFAARVQTWEAIATELQSQLECGHKLQSRAQKIRFLLEQPQLATVG